MFLLGLDLLCSCGLSDSTACFTWENTAVCFCVSAQFFILFIAWPQQARQPAGEAAHLSYFALVIFFPHPRPNPSVVHNSDAHTTFKGLIINHVSGKWYSCSDYVMQAWPWHWRRSGLQESTIVSVSVFGRIPPPNTRTLLLLSSGGGQVPPKRKEHPSDRLHLHCYWTPSLPLLLPMDNVTSWPLRWLSALVFLREGYLWFPMTSIDDLPPNNTIQGEAPIRGNTFWPSESGYPTMLCLQPCAV